MLYSRSLALLSCACLLALAGCDMFGDKSKKENQPDSLAAATGDKKPEAPLKPGEEEQQPGLTTFVQRLGDAVSKHDVDSLATLMTPKFGYSLDPVREGEGVFEFWDQNNLWLELELVLKEKFHYYDGFFVSPPEFVLHPDAYKGYRAGITKVKGRWRFAYFVSG
jgi:hypothetical protein